MRLRRLSPRLYKWVALGVVFLLLFGWLLASPASAGRSAKATYHALPTPVRGLVPDSAEQSLGGGVDAITRFFAFGQPSRLINLDLRLVDSSVAPTGWSSSHTLDLEWTDLGDGIVYELRAGHGPRAGTGGVDVTLGTFSNPKAKVALPGDGEWFVRVRPMAGGDVGRATSFGPFRVDSTAPPAPVLEPILPPPGYSFSLSWSPVSDTSGIAAYEVERKVGVTAFHSVGRTSSLSHLEDQLGNGAYTYRIRSVNGAGTLSLPSNEQKVTVKAPMTNPGKGSFLYGIHANYTSFMKIWDISTPSKYASVDEVPSSIKTAYLGDGYGFEVANSTLIAKTREIVGTERNTLAISEKLFIWLFEYADYDSGKLTASQRGDAGGLQSAGETYDRRLGICGDLATLYITMLRIAGVPARPVHGYLDNPNASVGDFHVWVEVWVGASLKSGDPSDTRDDWMTVDVSGISDDPFDVDALMVYFGIFNPEYLALGLNADYDDSSWNAWAQFGWSINPGMPNPQFVALGKPIEVGSEQKDLYFNPTTKKRVLVEANGDPPQGYTMFFPGVTVVSKKRIDYGVNVNGTEPVNATIRIRYPDADAFAAILPWQSVIYTIYSNSPTVDKEPGKQYTRLDPLGYVIWEDRFD